MLRKIVFRSLVNIQHSTFARQISTIEPEFPQDLKADSYHHLMVVPVRMPVFPHNSMVTQIHPLLYEHLMSKQIKHLGAFILKDNAEAVALDPVKFKGMFSKGTEDTKEDKDHKGHKEHEKHMEHEETKEHKETMDSKEHKETKEHKEHKETMDSKEKPTAKDSKEHSVPEEHSNSAETKESVRDLLENFNQNTIYDTMNFHQNIIYETSVLPENVELPQTIRVVGSVDDILPIGTICRVSYQKLTERGVEQIYMILKGVQRVQYLSRVEEEDLLIHANTQPIRESNAYMTDLNYKMKLSVLLGLYARLRQKIPINVPELVSNPTDPSTIDTLCGFLCLSTYFSRSEILALFTTLQLQDRMMLCQTYFERYSRELNTQWDSLESKTSLPVDPNTQKEKMKEIYDLLKKQFASASGGAFVEKITLALSGRVLPEHIQQVLQDELSQISELQENHPDFNIKKNFVELLVSLPFGVVTNDQYSLKQAQSIFEQSHFGMEKVKARIMEFLAVSKMRGSPAGKTLLLEGPPGVGKTSIASTIAESLGRKFVRVSLGGESDVSIIKGHRRTYMASYPGKIVQALKTAQTENPVILIDEIDKLGYSYRGNIADSLLEVLDPVQNSNFIDNYLDVPIDLSKVLFICSANLVDTIPSPLLDRMEVIELSGYTLEEKVQISERHLIPKILKDTGLLPYVHSHPLRSDILVHIIQYYCRESGVRSLQRTLQKLFEKLVVRVVKAQQLGQIIPPNLNITTDGLDDLIGIQPYDDEGLRTPIPGLGIGLAYNGYGGSILYIEIVPTSYVPTVPMEEIKDPSKVGSLKLTGQLGSTIKESAEIAYTHSKYILHTHFNNHFLEENQLHMHFPAGAVKKDGPSAGIAIASTLVSIALGLPIRARTAMTGEISLIGKVLRIGGLKEKVLAAKREGITTVIIPIGNRGDYEELPINLREGIEFHLVEDFKDVVNIVFDKQLQ